MNIKNHNKPRRAHCLQHVSFEGLGTIELWLKTAGYEITYSRFYELEAPLLPEIAAIDFLVVMGGPMSVNDEVEFPWLIEEKTFVHTCIEEDKPVLGVCLGAQLIASAMGAKVYQNKQKEIGWFPIQGLANNDDVFSFPMFTEVLHWHGETFDVPSYAVCIAKSEVCEYQAFQLSTKLGSKVIGLQFHLEVTEHSLQKMVSHCADEITATEVSSSKTIQSAETILSTTKEHYKTINSVMDDVLSYLLEPKK